MSGGDRPNLFESDDLDLAGFAPKAEPARDVPTAHVVQRVAEEGGFHSRPAHAISQLRQPLTYRTGRSASFTVKTFPHAVEQFYAVAQARGWKVAETFERAVVELVAAVDREDTKR